MMVDHNSEQQIVYTIRFSAEDQAIKLLMNGHKISPPLEILFAFK